MIKGIVLLTRIAIITHRQSQATRFAMEQILKLCRELSIEAVLPRREIEKHGLDAKKDSFTVVSDLDGIDIDLCVALGGDGTILRAFNRFPGMQTPVMGVNFGRVGFLSALQPEELPDRMKTILAGDFDTLKLSLIEMRQDEHTRLALNDVVVHKPDGGSVVRLAYSVSGVEFEALSCDGLVLSTPAGSTAYNLSNGGPIMSLSLETMALTAIAPHSLQFRALVIGEGDQLEIQNQTAGSDVTIYIDGRNGGVLAPDASIKLSLSSQKAYLVQPPGADFYRTLRDRFIQPSM